MILLLKCENKSYKVFFIFISREIFGELKRLTSPNLRKILVLDTQALQHLDNSTTDYITYFVKHPTSNSNGNAPNEALTAGLLICNHYDYFSALLMELWGVF